MDSELKDRVRNSFAKQGLMSTLGAEVGQVEPDYCTLILPYSGRVTQQHGFFHGGVTASLADTAVGFTSYTVMDEDQQPLTVEFKINFIAPTQGDALEARAKVVKSGYRLKHASVEVYRLMVQMHADRPSLHETPPFQPRSPSRNSHKFEHCRSECPD